MHKLVIEEYIDSSNTKFDREIRKYNYIYPTNNENLKKEVYNLKYSENKINKEIGNVGIDYFRIPYEYKKEHIIIAKTKIKNELTSLIEKNKNSLFYRSLVRIVIIYSISTFGPNRKPEEKLKNLFKLINEFVNERNINEIKKIDVRNFYKLYKGGILWWG